MPDPITIITALHGLAEKLVNSIKSGQDAAKAQEILRLVGELQTEYFTLRQHILNIETDNAKLIRQVAALKSPNPNRQENDTQVVVDLDDLSTKMLLAVANAPDGAWKQELFARFDLSLATGEHVLDQLGELDFIEVIPRFTPDGSPHRATRKGRDYLSRKDLL